MSALLDPLAAPPERFALGRPRSTPPDATSEPSLARPFGLRFGTPLAPVAASDVSEWRLCPDRQVAIRPDGADILDMTMNTSGPSGDGSSGGGAEEWGPDHHDDEDLPA